jgi:hypothetical protein
VDKDLLFKPRLPERDVNLPGIGIVRVRGLSRAEVLEAREDTTVGFEAAMLTAGVADPALTRDEVRRWMAAAPAGEIKPVTDAILHLSGLAQGADKSGLSGDGADAGVGVGSLSGGEAGDDGRPPTGGDARS